MPSPTSTHSYQLARWRELFDRLLAEDDRDRRVPADPGDRAEDAPTMRRPPVSEAR